MILPDLRDFAIRNQVCVITAVQLPKSKWKCWKCGRDKFDRPYVPHNCDSGYRKRRFNKFTIPLVVLG